MNNWIVEDKFDNIRIDRYISEHMENVSRSYIQKLIKDGMVTANSKPVRQIIKCDMENV